MKYKVHLRRTVTYFTVVDVEADNFETAKASAMAQADYLAWKEDKTKTEWVKSVQLLKEKETA